jgi:hypothetical protein
MKYMADTIVKYVLGETNRHSGMLRFVLPSYPSDLLLEIGCELDEQFSRITDRRVDWEYKIAYRLGKEWENGTSADQANFERVCEEGWYNEDDHFRISVRDGKGESNTSPPLIRFSEKTTARNSDKYSKTVCSLIKRLPNNLIAGL